MDPAPRSMEVRTAKGGYTAMLFLRRVLGPPLAIQGRQQASIPGPSPVYRSSKLLLSEAIPHLKRKQHNAYAVTRVVTAA